MRILMVGNLYPPHHFGGYEQVWQSAVSHLRSRGHEVRVLATGFRHPGVPDGDEPDVCRGLRWYWRDHDFARFGGRERLAIERNNHTLISRALNEFSPNVVSFWSMGGMSHSLIESVRRRQLPMVAFVHDQWLDYGRHTDQWTRMLRPPLRRPAAWIVERVSGIPTSVEYGAAGRYVFVSDFIRRRALNLQLALRETAVAHSGIDPGFLSPGEVQQWRWRLLHVGRLHPEKGIHEAVRALLHLPSEATLTFAGSWDPRDERSLGDLIGELGLESRVKLLGHRTHEEIAALYRSHDALLFPVCWDEPWGLVPLEAMGCGCPVVATGRGGSGEYLADGANCLIIPDRDPVALAAALTRIAEEPALRDRLRSGGFETAPLYTEPVFNAEVERHLTEVAGLAAGPEPTAARR